MSQPATPAKSDIETSTIRTISWRLIPFLVLAYFFSYLDRVNLGFAALTMNADLKFTPLIFAWGAGIFFIGYFIFEVPSNLALEKFGASRWIARIMVTWGIISAAMAMVSGELSFYVLRFLLGVAEAGFFPGIILYLTYWFPTRQRAQAIARFIEGDSHAAQAHRGHLQALPQLSRFHTSPLGFALGRSDRRLVQTRRLTF
jgi:MFS family permease